MSITLLANAINQLVIGGVTIETDNAAAVTNISLDFQNNLLLISLAKGVVAGVSFTQGTIGAGNLQIVINLTTGGWQVSGANPQSGTLSGVALSNIQTTLKGWRNNAESFANNNNIQPGTVVPW